MLFNLFDEVFKVEYEVMCFIVTFSYISNIILYHLIFR